MTIVAGSQIEVGRGLLAACLPLTGERSSGTMNVTLTAGNAVLYAGDYLVAVVDGTVRHDLVFKVAPRDDGTMKWSLPADGTAVNVHSNVGGARHNLPAGTVLRFESPIAGVDDVATVAIGGLAGGVDPVGDYVVRDVALYDVVARNGLELFRSGLKAFPALVAIWNDSDPADGLATSALRRGDSRVAEGQQLYAESWTLDVVVERKDSELRRRAQGLILMDEVTECVTDRMTVDGVVISQPSGVQIRRRARRQELPREIYQAFQVFSIELVATGNYVRRDDRTWSSLLKWRLDALKESQGDRRGDLPVVVNNLGTFPQS